MVLVITELTIIGFGYGNVSLAWGQFATWIQLQLPIATYTPFAVDFVSLMFRLPFGLLLPLSLFCWD